MNAVAFACKVVTIPPGRKGEKSMLYTRRRWETKTWLTGPTGQNSGDHLQGVKKSQKQGRVQRKKKWKRLKRIRESWPDKYGRRQCFRLWGEGKKRKSQRGRKGAVNSLRKDRKHSIKVRSSCFSSNSREMLNEKVGGATLLHYR